MTILTDFLEEEQFLAGEYVARGTYIEAGTSRRVNLDQADYLPGSGEGRMCTYFRAEDRENSVNIRRIYGYEGS